MEGFCRRHSRLVDLRGGQTSLGNVAGCARLPERLCAWHEVCALYDASPCRALMLLLVLWLCVCIRPCLAQAGLLHRHLHHQNSCCSTRRCACRARLNVHTHLQVLKLVQRGVGVSASPSRLLAYSSGMAVLCRWATVILRGMEVPMRHGHYGCKFAGPQLTFGTLQSYCSSAPGHLRSLNCLNLAELAYSSRPEQSGWSVAAFAVPGTCNTPVLTTRPQLHRHYI